eukprot:188920-Heterocapsa_arctica.AAC.1
MPRETLIVFHQLSAELRKRITQQVFEGFNRFFKVFKRSSGIFAITIRFLAECLSCCINYELEIQY